jgi:hypothetical protein
MVRAAFDQQGAILNSLQADMRVVRDAVMKLEAKEVIRRVDSLESNREPDGRAASRSA